MVHIFQIMLLKLWFWWACEIWVNFVKINILSISKNPFAHTWHIQLWFLPHTTFHFYLIIFQIDTDSPSKCCFFYCKITLRYSKICISRKCFYKEQKHVAYFFSNYRSLDLLEWTTALFNGFLLEFQKHRPRTNHDAHTQRWVKNNRNCHVRAHTAGHWRHQSPRLWAQIILLL